jgi:vitamin B12 transporter
MRKIVSTAIFLSFAAPTFADTSDEIIVTATRDSAGAERATLGASLTVIEPEELQTRQTRQISDVLRDVPGIAVSRSGGVGNLTQIRMRGSESNHTLVLIDGMEVSDPYTGEFDFATLIADDVARIEVLRGQQSALYGSDAIGGVVHYITASGAEASGVRGRAEYGSNNAFDGSVRVADVAGPLDYALSAGYQSTDGEPTARNGVRDVGARNAALSGRATLALAENVKLRLVGRYTDTEADVNNQDFNFPPGPTYGLVVDSNAHDEVNALYGLASLEASFGAWSHALSAQGVDSERESFDAGALAGASEGGRVKASYVLSYDFDAGGAAHTLTGAVDGERERFRNAGPVFSPEQGLEREIDNVGVLAQWDARVGDRYGFGASIRHDDNDRFDDAVTWRVQGSARVAAGTRLHAASGSGIKNPGIFELFGFDPGNFIGNPELKPEESEGWEIGVEQTFSAGAFVLDATYFDNTLQDEIATNFVGPFFTATPVNLTTESTQKGVEVSARAVLGQWRVQGAYTWLDAEQNGVEEARRPEQVASLNVSWRSSADRYGAFLTARHNGEMLDNNFTLSGPPRVTLPAFTLLNFGGDVRLTERLDLYARVENALDEDYEEVFTYRAPGRAAFIGVRAGF